MRKTQVLKKARCFFLLLTVDVQYCERLFFKNFEASMQE